MKGVELHLDKYITILGDTFDNIAYKTLGDCKYIKEIINANRKYVDVMVFDAGIEINIPEIEEKTKGVVPWKK